MKILIADDERNIREIMIKLLELEGMGSRAVENGLAAQRVLQEEEFDAFVCDLKMPGMDGQELLEWIQKSGSDIPVIMISAFGQAEDAVKALKRGAFDYIVKPFDPDELIHRIRNAVNTSVMKRKISESDSDNSYIAHSSLMKEVKRKIDKVAGTPSTVLITGESGTGKEVTARYIHKQSLQAKGPFMSINIGGIPENLLESELFGHEKGAFTGADKQKKGLFEAAADGTLFLDEIGEMPKSLQVKILRVLQEKSVRRLGGITEIPVRARIISATNRNLEECVVEGSFREDLFYRLNIARIELPPLRKRKEDLVALITLLLQNLNTRMGTSLNDVTSESLGILEKYSFPGNIRELENILERACIYSEGNRLESNLLELPLAGETLDAKPATGTLKSMERKRIIEALQRWEGNRTRAARELGITRRTIQNKIIEYGLEKTIL